MIWIEDHIIVLLTKIEQIQSVYLGKCNFTVKTDTKFIKTLERNMNKLF